MSQAAVQSISISERSPRTVAVIDIGATSIRMAIAEIHGRMTDQQGNEIGGSVRTLETLLQSVELGREVFQNRKLSRKSIEKTVSVLVRYKLKLAEYGIDVARDVTVVATTAVREASNRIAFTDRIYVATGFNVVPIDEAEVSRITYMGVMPHLSGSDAFSEGKSIVVEVGGGNTELLIIRGGNVLHSQSVRLGSLRLLNTLEGVRASAQRRRNMLESHIRRMLAQIIESIKVDASMQLIALGGEMRFAANQLLEDWNTDSLAKVPTKRLERLTESILRLDADEIVRRYDASFVEAETLGPSLLCYTLLAKHFDLENVFVCDTNLRDGLLHDMAANHQLDDDFRNQIVRSAISLGRKFGFDETHASNVAHLARKLFQQLAELHQLDHRHEVMLFVAALLHEIGLIVNTRSNHKHALYLIRNSELFGLSQGDLLLIGLVARYHRRATPQPSHEGYGELDQASRVVVSKLASILRLAIALDDTRSGRIRQLHCKLSAKNSLSANNHLGARKLVINAPGVDDVSIEQVSMRENSGLFRDTFGMPVLLSAGK